MTASDGRDDRDRRLRQPDDGEPGRQEPADRGLDAVNPVRRVVSVMPSCALDRWVEVTRSALMVGPSIGLAAALTRLEIGAVEVDERELARDEQAGADRSGAGRWPAAIQSDTPWRSRDGGSSIIRQVYFAAAGLRGLLELAHLPSDAGSTMSATAGGSPLRHTARPPRASPPHPRPYCLPSRAQEDPRLLRPESVERLEPLQHLGAVGACPSTTATRPDRRGVAAPLVGRPRAPCSGCDPPSSRGTDAQRAAACTPRRRPPDRAPRSAPRRGARAAPAASPAPRTRSPSALLIQQHPDQQRERIVDSSSSAGGIPGDVQHRTHALHARIRRPSLPPPRQTCARPAARAAVPLQPHRLRLTCGGIDGRLRHRTAGVRRVSRPNRPLPSAAAARSRLSAATTDPRVPTRFGWRGWRSRPVFSRLPRRRRSASSRSS